MVSIFLSIAILFFDSHVWAFVSAADWNQISNWIVIKLINLLAVISLKELKENIGKCERVQEQKLRSRA